MVTKKRQRQEARERRKLGPVRRLLVIFSYLMGLSVFFVSITLSLLAVPPKWWPLPEIAWSVFILALGAVTVILHLFVGFLLGGPFDRMLADRRTTETRTKDATPAGHPR